MAPIATYVFFDLGTTGLRDTDPKITELHMIAIRCDNLRKYFREGGEEYDAKPPACEKFHCRRENDVMWFISREGEDYDFYENCSLKDETVSFLEDLEKPVCLIAQNGNKFDFPLLKDELADAEGFSPKEIVCADSMAAFYDILEPDSRKTSYKERKRGSFPWPDYHSGRKTYRLEEVYKRKFQVKPILEGAKDRNKALVKIALRQGFEFMLWVAENNKPLTSFF
ncbi:three prime repair exonuclease 2-like [Cydia pomonella]|uniref:three prime repair exonuclease 2-like n=1 Tax=Cydia pomonella TaxID=82600 RepID=UPI002ADE4406|nr:three prime repair exonuclease 2-like [Cydia pomonella]